ncbi:serine/arginine repetitive matrix protein 2 isoform X1 [Harpegnathos saltator]|uniref:serine/arginine repetitive matrix protein 2 isoform X1 n=2 Tax=Harpegnathos saltator TaxID=610380 RepID=UPI000948BB70|nr:serine/arginine repetitive matrix protein 2 isoform X1 [Harpegnathos saltator]
MQREEHKPITMDDDKQVGETSSSEVANRFRSCRDLSDIVSLYPPRALYLKPLAKVNVSVNLPQLKTPGKTISTWEVMEKIRALILPDEFVSLKVAKSTLEFIRLEGDLRDRCRLQRVLARLDLQRLNLAGFTSVLKVRAAETKDDFPTRHNWDSYFRDAKHMNELKAGERPDTIHISGLPVKWFTEDDSNTPSESLIVKIFKKWGALRRVDVPAADPYRSRMRLGNNIHKFSYEEGIYFDVYIQYVEYMAFVRAMDALRGMKLLKKDEQNSLTATMKVDFDKTKHMSDNSVSHRDFERKRLIAQDNLAAEKLRKKEEEEKKRREEQKKKEEADSAAKVSRQQKREEKRKRKALKMFRKQEEDKVSMKIAREEQKLIKAQRQLESMRLLDELFDRIKTKVEKNEIKLGQNMNVEARKDDKKNDQTGENANKLDSESEKKGKKEDVKKKKLKKEKKKKKKRKKKRRKDDDSGSDSSLETLDKETSNKKMKNVLTKNNCTPSSADATLPYADAYDPIQMLRISTMSRYPSMSPGMQMMRIPMSRYPGAQMLREPMARYHYPVSSMRRGRGYFPRCDVSSYALTNPYLYNEDYYEYFTHIVNQDSKRQSSKSRNRRKSTSRSISKTRNSKTRSNSKTRARSASRSRSRRRSGSRFRSSGKRSKSTSRSRSRSRSRRSRSRRKSRSRSRSKSRSRRKSASRSASRKRTRTRTRSRSGSKHRSATRSRSKRRSSSRSKRRSSRSVSRSRTRRSRSRRKSRSKSRSRSRGSARNRYRKRHGGRSSSVVRITRAKSRTASPKRRSRSSSWSVPRSPDRRSVSWSKAVPETNVSENVNKISDVVIQQESLKVTKAQQEVAANQQDLKA